MTPPPTNDRRLDLVNSPNADRGGRLWSRCALVALIVVAVVGGYLTVFRQYFGWDSIRDNVGTWRALAQATPMRAAALFFLIYTATTTLSLPAATVLGLVAGALFGRLLGTAVVSGASTAGATLAFVTSRYLLHNWVQNRYANRLRVINEGIERDGAFYLFLLRLTPVVPFFLINLGMGLTPMRARTFAVTSWFGMLPGTFLYVNAGLALATIESPRDVLSTTVVVSLAALGIVPLALRKLIRWRVGPRA
jgi:uncharacterized membrane protein YdjX (TVP38/TMEM64 family)